MDYEERQSLRSRSVNMNVCVPLTLAELIDRISEAEDLPTNRVMVRLIRKGLRVERDERAAKANAS